VSMLRIWLDPNFFCFDSFLNVPDRKQIDF
jgi:hypothetical protein